MPNTADKNVKLAYKILDYIARCEKREVDLTSKRVVNAVAKIIDEFDGRETVELKHMSQNSGHLRGITSPQKK